MSDFRDKCDEAYNLLLKFKHMGDAEFQYELNISSPIFLRIRNYLIEKHGFKKLGATLGSFNADSYLCHIHHRCLVTPEEYEKMKKEKDNMRRLRKAR